MEMINLKLMKIQTQKIKVRMIGGKGNDTFNIKGNVRNYIYDIVSTWIQLQKKMEL